MPSTIRAKVFSFSCLSMLLILAGCEPAKEEFSVPTLQTGYWDAQVALPNAEIDTGFEIDQDNDGNFSATLINGQERVRIDDVRFENGELLLRFPAFNNEIRAVLADEKLSGELTLVKRHGNTQSMPFEASFGNPDSSRDDQPAAVDLSGRWAVQFHRQDGSSATSIGEFAQRGSKLFGTFLNPNGDYRFLTGHVRGRNFKMSTFDGAHAYVFEGELSEDGEIHNADFHSGTSWQQKWSASRNEDITLPDGFERTFLKAGYDRFEFSFPDENGNMVSLDDEKYDGKVVLVTLAGTWCPNCNDEAAFLAPFYKEYRDDGLEIVMLLFEHFEDRELANQQAKNFRKKFDIEFDILVAGISDKAQAEELLPSLSSVLAFPTTIFIDKSGRVRNIYAGFNGPGTGDHYRQLQQRFTDVVTGLLEEPDNLIEQTGDTAD